MLRVTSTISKTLIRVCLALFLAASSFFVFAISTGERAYAAPFANELGKSNSRVKVSFNANGGSLPLVKRSKVIKKGSLFGTLPVPQRSGYVFKGWYTGKKGGVLVTSKTIVKTKGNRTLYARWEKPQRIACVGASNVVGASLENKKVNSFPGKLQKKLGERYTVGNFGSSGTTAILHSGRAYMHTRNFARSIAFKPDKVIILVGGNDRGKRYWTAYAQTYKNTDTLYNKIADRILEDYKKLLMAYAKHVPKSEIYIMTPADPIPKSKCTQYLELTSRINMRLKSLAKKEGYRLIDVNSAIKTNPCRYLQEDGAHFSLAGAEKVASMAYRAVK